MPPINATLTGSGYQVDPILAPPFPYIGTFAWASLPSAASYSGYMARVSDVGVSPGIMVVSDGTRWLPAGRQLLARGAGATHVNSLSELALVTVTIPAGLLGLLGGLDAETVWTHVNSVNTKTMRVRLGGIGGTAFAAIAATTSATERITTKIRNTGAANAQVGAGSATANAADFTANAGAHVTGAVDTSAATSLVISAQNSAATETITLNTYAVWVTP